MKGRILVLLTTAVLFLLPALGTAFAGEVEWDGPSFDDVLKTAKSENKHVFIDFYATWCGPCKKLDKVTYQDTKVADYLNSIVAVKYDAEKDEGEVLAKKFRIRAYPTLVLLGPDGKEVDRHVGYLDAEDFLDVIKGYQEGVGTVAYYEDILKKNPDDTDALYTLGMKHADAVRSKDAQAAFDKLLKIDPDTEHKADIYNQLGYVMYVDDRYEDAIVYYDKLIAGYPDTKYHDEALQMQARVYYSLEKKDKCLEVYQVYLDRHPDDTSAMNGFAWFCAQRSFGFEQALPVALKAADLSDRDPGILDTLAELYFAMGDYDNAIKVGKEALDKEPDDKYLKDQLDKFQKAASEQARR
jgi:thioredoxin 1